MTTPAEAEVLDFLTSKENVPFVVEILRRSEQVRDRVLEQFWNGLKSHVEASAPTLPASSPVMKLRSEQGVREKYAGLCYAPVDAPAERQCLRHCIYQCRSKTDFSIWQGISWDDGPPTPTKSSKLYKLPSVVKLRERLKQMDFEEGGTCIGFQDIPGYEYETLDLFLSAVVKDADGLMQELSKKFWDLVEETLEMVEKANKEIVARGR